MAAKLYTNLFHNELALFAGLGARSTGRGVESSARLRGAGSFFSIFLGRLLHVTEIRSRCGRRLLFLACADVALAAPARSVDRDTWLHRPFQHLVSDEFL